MPRFAMIEYFARHPVAANLALLMMVLLGLWTVHNIPTSLNPKVNYPAVSLDVDWPGASAEDVEQLITVPIEQSLRTTAHLVEMTSTSRLGHMHVALEFTHDADMTQAVDQIKQRIANIRNFPADMEQPVVNRIVDHELVASILVTGPGTLAELVPLARAMERDLLARGIDAIAFDGLPEQEIAIQISSQRLREMNRTLDQLADDIAGLSSNVPAGTVGRAQGSRQLRSLDQRRDVSSMEQLYVHSGDQLVRMGNIAQIQHRARDDSVEVRRLGKPTIEMLLLRHTETDAIRAADIMKRWVAEVRPTLPKGVQLLVYKEAWQLLGNQLSLVGFNAVQSLLLVVGALALFLNWRVAGWVAAGAPVAVLFGLALYHYIFGGSINILTLLGIIMVLGIVVDDGIVVAEDIVALHERGMSAGEAVVTGARRMFVPVLASALTTLAAFVPLMIVGGVMGDIVMSLPEILFCIIVASLIECFFILPTHLRGSLTVLRLPAPTSFRARFDTAYTRFRDGSFATWVRRAIAYPGATLALALVTVFIAIALIVAQRVGINFVTGLDLDSLSVNIEFAASATDNEKAAFVAELEQSLAAADKQLGGNCYSGYITKAHVAELDREIQSGRQFASVDVMYAFAEARRVAPQVFLDAWRARVRPPAYVERLVMKVEGGANGGAPDITFVLRDRDVVQLKNAADALASRLATYGGVSNVRDDLPYGKEQLIFALTPNGRALGLTGEGLGAQLRAAFSGRRVQIFNEDDAEVEVRVLLPDDERDSLLALRQFPVMAPSGSLVPLDAVAELTNRRGIDVIRHNRGELAVHVSADVNAAKGNTFDIIGQVTANVLPALAQQFGVSYGLSGKSEDDARLLSTLGFGAILTVIFIYLILVWTFSSYAWPFAIMIAIPFGFAGAIFGHWIVGIDIGAMSMLAFFALTGIVVNDSIVLISAFRDELAAGYDVPTAIERAVLLRVRAVLLTTLTTVAGLCTLIFQTSSLSIYIAPIAVTICFGLGYATFLVLFVVPALIVLIDAGSRRLRAGRDYFLHALLRNRVNASTAR